MPRRALCRAGQDRDSLRRRAEPRLPQPAPVRLLRSVRERGDAGRPQMDDPRPAALRPAGLRLAARGARLLRSHPAQVATTATPSSHACATGSTARNAMSARPAFRFPVASRCACISAPAAPTRRRTRSRATAAGRGKNSWAAIPLGLPVLGGFDEVANQMLTYELSVDEAVQLAGPVSAHLEFSCNEIDSRRGGAPEPHRRRRNPTNIGCRWARSARHAGGTIPQRSTALRVAIDTGDPGAARRPARG